MKCNCFDYESGSILFDCLNQLSSQAGNGVQNKTLFIVQLIISYLFIFNEILCKATRRRLFVLFHLIGCSCLVVLVRCVRDVSLQAPKEMTKEKEKFAIIIIVDMKKLFQGINKLMQTSKMAYAYTENSSVKINIDMGKAHIQSIQNLLS